MIGRTTASLSATAASIGPDAARARRGTQPTAVYGSEDRRLASALRAAARAHSVWIADCLSAGTAASAALWIVEGPRGTAVALLCCAVAAWIYHAAGGHQTGNAGFSGSTLDELPRVAVLAALLTLVLTILYPSQGHAAVQGWRVATLWCSIAMALVTGRVLVRAVVGRILGPERCLVIGSITEARRVQRRLQASGANATVAGVLAPAQLSHDGDADELLEALTTVVVDIDADCLIVAASGQDERTIVNLVQVARLEGIGITLSSALLDVAAPGTQLQHITGMTLMASTPAGSGRLAGCVTRGIDLVFAALLLLATAPILALIALAVKLDSPGPVFFRQLRVGRHGANFHILKFRSMGVDAEMRKAALRHRSEVGAEMFKLHDDPRVTRVGKLLRRTSLDELPQLINVLRGEMTLVGPRPLVLDEDAAIKGLGRARLRRTPGMTGPWQVLRERVAQQEMLEIDYGYVTNWSLWMDVKILVRTALHVIRIRNV